PFKAPLHFGKRREIPNSLDRDGAVQASVVRPIHLPHPPRADVRQNLVRTEMTTGGERHAPPLPESPPVRSDFERSTLKSTDSRATHRRTRAAISRTESLLP